MHTVKKVIKTVKTENKNYKQELNGLLRNYHTTPHSTTRVTPTTALFGRPMKTKLPESLFTPHVNPSIIENDQRAKAKMKRYADIKPYVWPSNAVVGDAVFVIREDNAKQRVTRLMTQSAIQW